MALKIIKKKKSFKSGFQLNKNKLPKGLSISTYNIVYEPLERETLLPEEFEEQMEELRNMIDEKPQKAIPRLKELIAKYPEVRILYNWLAMALSNAGRYKDVDLVIIENYQKNPDYLFAKLNYTELCLRNGNFEEIPEIFEHKFDLKMLYPERDTFHISEVVGFFGMTGLYHIETGNIDAAMTCLELINDLAPEHPVTSKMIKKLAPMLFEDIPKLKRLLNSAKDKSKMSLF